MNYRSEIVCLDINFVSVALSESRHRNATPSNREATARNPRPQDIIPLVNVDEIPTRSAIGSTKSRPPIHYFPTFSIITAFSASRQLLASFTAYTLFPTRTIRTANTLTNPHLRSDCPPPNHRKPTLADATAVKFVNHLSNQPQLISLRRRREVLV
jgi:hypothetical protein